MDHHSFSFFPFGALYCLTLISIIATYLLGRVMSRRDDKHRGDDAAQTLNHRFASGEIDAQRYQELKELLRK